MSLEKAIELHKTQIPENRLKAFEIFKEIDANYWLGYYHQYGYANLKIDENKACDYYKLATDENNADATYRLASFELKKIATINDDYKKNYCSYVTSLFKKAADLNHLEACYQYGDILVNGKLRNKKDIET
ncbi:12595_t:CDS:1, partial [Cetraspora pellucida]